MIKVTADKGNVSVHEVSGNGVQIMSELCCIVAAVCQGWSEDEYDREENEKAMIECVARTLLNAEDNLNGKKVNRSYVCYFVHAVFNVIRINCRLLNR